MAQIIHVDGMCNECGNCLTFCPYDSAPYKEKFTLFGRAEDFADSKNEGFLCVDSAKSRFRVRLDGTEKEYSVADKACGLPEDIRMLICAAQAQYGYLFF